MNGYGMVTLGVLAAGIGCATDMRPATPQIGCRESTFDFGAAPAGEGVHHVFVVRNTGRELLHIHRAQGS